MIAQTTQKIKRPSKPRAGPEGMAGCGAASTAKGDWPDCAAGFYEREK